MKSRKFWSLCLLVLTLFIASCAVHRPPHPRPTRPPHEVPPPPHPHPHPVKPEKPGKHRKPKKPKKHRKNGDLPPHERLR